MQVARADLPITRLRSFTMWYGRDAPDEVARHLNQVEHRPVPPALRMMFPELDYTRKTRRCVGPTRVATECCGTGRNVRFTLHYRVIDPTRNDSDERRSGPLPRVFR